MTLGELIAALEQLPADHVAIRGFHYPHSYRGHYEQLAFEPFSDVPFGEMLAFARHAVDTGYGGWEGGWYEMTSNTIVHLAYHGESNESGEPITEETIEKWRLFSYAPGEAQDLTPIYGVEILQGQPALERKMGRMTQRGWEGQVNGRRMSLDRSRIFLTPEAATAMINAFQNTE